MEAKLRSDPTVVFEWLWLNVKGRKPKVHLQAMARMIAETARGSVDTWWGQVLWETSLNDHECHITLNQ